ncbi:MAG: hypothetical protein Q9184_006012 [Pyrenodesmia sp. 2 TL-2023]
MAAGAMRTAPEPTLYGLPPETRQMIYHHLFDGAVFYPSRNICKKNKLDSVKKAHAVLFACKRFYFEAVPILYSRGTLRLFIKPDTTDQLADICRIIPPHSAATITSVRFNVQRGTLADNLWMYGDALIVWPACLQPFLDDLPSLRELQITCKRLLRIENSQPAPMDYRALKDVSIVVKPEHVDRTPIKHFNGWTAVPFRKYDYMMLLDCPDVSFQRTF